MVSLPYNVIWGYSQNTYLQIHIESGNIVKEINLVELFGKSSYMTTAKEMHNKRTQTECNDLQTIQNLREELEILKLNMKRI